MALREPVAVDLEPMPQPRLHDAITVLDRGQQPVDIVHQVVVDPVQVLGHDRSEEEPTESGRRIDGQHEMAEREPPCRLGRPRVPDLDLGEQHGVQT